MKGKELYFKNQTYGREGRDRLFIVPRLVPGMTKSVENMDWIG